MIDTVESRATAAAERWYVVVIMCLVYAVNIADRYVVSTVLEPIRLVYGQTATGGQPLDRARRQMLAATGGPIRLR